MKKGVLYLGAVALVGMTLWSCDQNDSAVQPDSSTTSALSSARLASDTSGFYCKKSLTKLAAADLPQSVSKYVSEKYAGAAVSYAAKDESGNFLVAIVQNSERKTLLFNSDGTFNKEVARPAGKGGRGDARRDSLQTIAAADLPANVTAYVKTTYPGATINLAAKDVNRGYFVMITVGEAKKTLIFNTDGTFKEEVVRKVRDRFTAIETSALPSAVTTYIRQNYAGSTVEQAGKNTSGQFLVWVKPASGRPVALVFAADGSFVQKLEHRR